MLASQDDLAGASDVGVKAVFPKRDLWIELVGREDREVTVDDLEL